MKKELGNLEVRKVARDAGVNLWQIADELGISEPTMTRMMRKPLNVEQRAAVMTAIEKIVSARDAGGEWTNLSGSDAGGESNEA